MTFCGEDEYMKSMVIPGILKKSSWANYEEGVHQQLVNTRDG
jgi:hypothetical protein